MPDVNYLAVALAALSAFVLGGLWYSPMLFANKWMALSGQSEEKLKSGNMGMIFGGAFVCALISAFMLALLFEGRVSEVQDAASAGFGIGLGIVAASLGLNYFFERRPLGLWLINGGYFVLQFTIMGAIIGAMG